MAAPNVNDPVCMSRRVKLTLRLPGTSFSLSLSLSLSAVQLTLGGTTASRIRKLLPLAFVPRPRETTNLKSYYTERNVCSRC